MKKEDRTDFKSFMKKLKKGGKKFARKTLINAGIIDKNGKLKDMYK